MGTETGKWKLGYRPELDGVRAIAVVLVLLGHGGVTGMGFAAASGVYMFFALSGFLITTLILEERSATGRLNYRAFWRRRAVRLLPAVAVLLAVVMLLPLVRERPSGTGLLSIAFYTGNWMIVAHPEATVGGFNPLGSVSQLWSLAVEEQFYVLWPIALIVMLRFLSLKVVTWIIAGAVVASIGLRVALWDGGLERMTRIYYGTDTNAFALLAGCALAALVAQVGGLKISRFTAILGAGLILLTFGTLELFDYATGTTFGLMYHGWPKYLLLPVLAVMGTVIIVGHFTGARSRLLSLGAVVVVGRVSYALYLWHWPIYMGYERYIGPIEGRWERLVPCLVLTGLCAAGSWHLVEKPMSRFKAGRAGRSAGHAVGHRHVVGADPSGRQAGAIDRATTH